MALLCRVCRALTPKRSPPRRPSSYSTAGHISRRRPRPSEIPYQPKVANSLNFIGVVQSPVQFLASPDGKYWAATTISQDQPSNSPISIPIVFEGDLAHTVACHLKENDNIYIAGHLSADKLPLTLSRRSQDYFQVIVNSFNFVQGSSYAKSQFKSDKQDLKPNAYVSGKMAFGFWEDLINNPTEWRDFRNDKINKVVKPKHPDFKHREDGSALWLNTAPSWILEKLEGLEFNSQVGVAKKSLADRGDYEGSGDESWKDLIANPNKWWDNRCDKATVRHPDFRHKDTGEGLWLNQAPEWAIHQLSPPANK